jgi:immune inhibitor A
MDRSEKVVLSIFLGLVCLCLLVGIICGGSIFFKRIAPVLQGMTEETPFLAEPTQMVSTVEVIPTASSTIVPDGAYDTLEILKNTVVPSSDLVSLTEKFEGMKDIPRTLTTAPINYQLGDTLGFWISNTDTNKNRLATTYLAYESDSVYFWVEQGVTIDQQQLKSLMNDFSQRIYPKDQEFFGKEWIPGVDNDSHLYILFAKGLGSDIAGYCSSTDTVLPEAHEYSNAHEMIYLSADNLTLDDSYTLSVLAHEFQHLIHGYHDPNEETWLNEGFSELAVLINGYDPGGFDYLFAQDPDIQLNEWPNNGDTSSHYGSGFLFTTYLMERFGEETTKAVVASQSNGLDSIDQVFNDEGIVDSNTGKQMTANQLFMDWALANYLNDPSILDGRFAYTLYDNLPYFGDTEEITDCSEAPLVRDVSQYGTDYIHLYCLSDYTLTFSGPATINILPVTPVDGDYFVWSNKADVSDMTMTQQFDFTNVSTDITLSYTMWYDLETDYDYLYLLASTDGESWEMVETPSCTTGNISGNNFGCGYNDVTNGWVSESVDLSKYAGEKIWLRFEYVTDTAVTGEGFAIDQISLPAVDYYTDFETDNGGWDLQGFVRIQNQIPQTYLVSLIQYTDQGPVITQKQVTPGEQVSFDIVNPSIDDGVVLVVSGSARYSRQKTEYQLDVVEN